MYLNLFFSSRRRHTILQGDWSSDVCSSDLEIMSLSQVECAVGVVANHGVVTSDSEGARKRGQRAGLIVNDQDVCLQWQSRSEERRVGKECRSRWSPYH